MAPGLAALALQVVPGTARAEETTRRFGHRRELALAAQRQLHTWLRTALLAFQLGLGPGPASAISTLAEQALEQANVKA